eukprot:548104-Rhodomonas_salina.1
MSYGDTEGDIATMCKALQSAKAAREPISQLNIKAKGPGIERKKRGQISTRDSPTGNRTPVPRMKTWYPNR